VSTGAARRAARWQVLLAAGMAVFAGLLAVMMTVLAVGDADVATRGVRAVAIVEEVGPERRSRQDWRVELRLRAPFAGAEVTGWAEPPMRVTGSWEKAPQLPLPGQGIEGYVMPDTPPRIVPVNAVGSRWSWVLTLPLYWLFAAGAAWAVWRVRAA
jgi:hypothetical protein